jgi:preprotein translocase subunit SecG
VEVYINITLIILSLLLIILVLLQAKGGGLGAIFGGDSGVYRTRRGVERTVFNLTIAVSALFLLTAFISALVG